MVFPEKPDLEKLQKEVAFLQVQVVQLSIASSPYGKFIILSPIIRGRPPEFFFGQYAIGHDMKRLPAVFR